MRAASAALLLVLASGCVEPACPPGDPSAARPSARFAVVSSDYSSTAVGLLDADGALLDESWIDSGSVAPRIVAPLSGDVVLPTTPLGACTLAVIDRLGTDVVTLLDACAGGVVGQLDVGATFSANPQDVVPLPDGRALVTRFEPNGDPAAPPQDRGNDALIVELDPPRTVGRIDLSAHDAGEALARPGRALALEANGVTRVLVGLARLGRRFDEAGPGAVVALDVDTGDTALLDLAPLASCDVVAAIPDAPSRALVRCGGRPFSTEEGRRSSAGLVLVELGVDGALHETARWGAADHPASPVYDTGAIPLGGARVLVAAKGDLLLEVNDRVAVVDLETGEEAPLFEAGSAFVIGEGTIDGDLVLLPDAHLGAVRRYRLEAGSLRALDPVETAPCRGLPPREVRRIAP